MRIVITGSAGRIGKALTAELGTDYDLSLIDSVPSDDNESIVADLREPIADDGSTTVAAAFKQADVLIHLAIGADAPDGAEEILSTNLHLTWNVMAGAAHYGVRRIVYASSHHVVRGHELELQSGSIDRRKIGPDAKVRPISYYGVEKICGEALGASLVESGRIESFIAVRIGNFKPDEPSNAHKRLFGITPRDLRSLFRRCVEAKFIGAHVVYGVSAQDDGLFDLSNAEDLLGWRPMEIPS